MVNYRRKKSLRLRLKRSKQLFESRIRWCFYRLLANAATILIEGLFKPDKEVKRQIVFTAFRDNILNSKCVRRRFILIDPLVTQPVRILCIQKLPISRSHIYYTSEFLFLVRWKLPGRFLFYFPKCSPANGCLFLACKSHRCP